MGALPSLPLPTLFSPDVPTQLKSSGQHRFGANGSSIVVPSATASMSSSNSPATSSKFETKPQYERVSGPHLRAVVLVTSTALFFAARVWFPEVSLFLFMLICTTSSSALWCTPNELVLSLGPIPVCFFRRRIQYKDIASVTIIRGRFQVFAALARRSLRLWQPLGFAYGLTLGKALIDIIPQSADDDTTKKARKCFTKHSILVSVDAADDIIAHILFRQQHGPETPLPASLVVNTNDKLVKWVWCDLLELLLSWHARNQALCDVCGLLLQPLKPTDEGYIRHNNHARMA